MKPCEVACVILGSGLSERFGIADKLEASLCGIPVLEYVLKTAERVGFGECFLVSRRHDFGETNLVINENPKFGQGHALRLGLEAARRKGWNTVCVLLGDMPLVSADHIRGLIDAVDDKKSVISEFRSTKMPPAIFNNSAISKIASSSFKEGARSMFEQLDLLVLPITEIQSLDVDTQEDFIRIERIMEAQRS